MEGTAHVTEMRERAEGRTFGRHEAADAARTRHLEAEVAELREMLRRLQERDSVPNGEPTTATRRGLLRLAGAAAVGAVGATLAASTPAAANNGVTTDNAEAQTTVDYLGSATSGNAFTFTARAVPGATPNLNGRAALAGVTVSESGMRNGVHGWTDDGSGAGVLAENAAVAGTALSASAPQGVGVRASGATGLAAEGTQIGVSASAPIGFYTSGSTRCAIWISPTVGGAPRTVPGTRTDAHQAGEIDLAAGALWLCTVSGTPGTWVSLGGAGGAISGGFHPITPSRVYDSRGAGGPLAAGSSRTVSVADALDPATLQVSTANIVPSGATAITANVTVVGTVGAGFLSANPAGDGVVHAATVNWFASGQILNNGVTLTLGGDRSLTVIAGGSGGAQTDFVVDVTGWF